MSTAKERYDAAAQRHHDALQKLLNKNASDQDLAAQLVQAKADLDAKNAAYDALLSNIADYFDAASQQIEAAIAANAP